MCFSVYVLYIKRFLTVDILNAKYLKHNNYPHNYLVLSRSRWKVKITRTLHQRSWKCSIGEHISNAWQSIRNVLTSPIYLKTFKISERNSLKYFKTLLLPFWKRNKHFCIYELQIATEISDRPVGLSLFGT